MDSHYWPLTWDESQYDTGAYRRIGSRSQPANAAFTLQETTPFTLNRVDSTATGNILETKFFAPEPAVSQFHDALGYYPGFYWNR